MVKATGRNVLAEIAITAGVDAGGAQWKMARLVCSLRWYLRLLKTSLGERNQWCYQQSISCVLTFTIPKQMHIFSGGWRVTKDKASIRKKIFAFLFNSHLWGENLVNSQWMMSSRRDSLQRVASGTVAVESWLDRIIKKDMVSHKKKVEN